MTDNKEKVLNEEELEQVNGGGHISEYLISESDAFHIHILQNSKNDDPQAK